MLFTKKEESLCCYFTSGLLVWFMALQCVLRSQSLSTGLSINRLLFHPGHITVSDLQNRETHKKQEQNFLLSWNLLNVLQHEFENEDFNSSTVQYWYQAFVKAFKHFRKCYIFGQRVCCLNKFHYFLECAGTVTRCTARQTIFFWKLSSKLSSVPLVLVSQHRHLMSAVSGLNHSISHQDPVCVSVSLHTYCFSPSARIGQDTHKKTAQNWTALLLLLCLKAELSWWVVIEGPDVLEKQFDSKKTTSFKCLFSGYRSEAGTFCPVSRTLSR